MYLDYSKLRYDSFGRPEVPELTLLTLSGKAIGVLPHVSELQFHIKFSELSEMSFQIPKTVDGKVNPLYSAVTGYKLIYTEHYGVYLVMSPEETGDGLSETKQVTCYSREKILDTKRFFLAEGTYNFWNPASPGDTLLGMMLENAPGWHAGYVSPALIGRYRTFDEYSDDLLSFAYTNAPEKYRCVFVFDPYEMAVNVYDADEERPALPIYLDFENLVQSVKVEEMSEELVTAMRPYGADSLDIRAVNPIGTNWIYDLSYFLENGSIDGELAQRWTDWQHEVESTRNKYNGLVALQASATAALLAAKAMLTDLNGELTDLTNQQSITIQAQALESTDAGREYQQNLLTEINEKIAAKKTEISAQEDRVAALELNLNGEAEGSYAAQIAAIVKELSFTGYFTAEEQDALSHYILEEDLTESTFVATDVDTTISGQNYDMTDASVAVAGSKVIEVDLSDELAKRMFTLSGGTFAISGSMELSGDIIRGTVEIADNGGCVCSIYAGSIVAGESKTAGGMLTISGTSRDLATDVVQVNENEIISYEGTQVSFGVDSGALYLTADVNDFQKYSVQLELLDFAQKTLADVAMPTYEFSVESGNFIFAKEFEPFKNKLELGKGIYLRISDELVITPLAIELELDFEKQENFSLVFSNRFKRHDNVATLKDMLDKGYNSSRTIDASKHIYNRAANTVPGVTEFLDASIKAAQNAIVAAANQSVLINGAGIQVGGDSKYQMRIIDNMIAMTDDNWQTAKLAIGRFCSDEIGEHWGVNAEVLGGKLLVGNNLIIEDVNDKGVMTFRVDASGAWLYNASIVMQDEASGTQMLLSPEYGFVAGKGQLYTTDGTTVVPNFLDEDGKIKLNADGTPTDTGLSFYFDSQTGNMYLKGTIDANAGEIGGWTIAEDFLHSGKGDAYVALNASGSNEYSAFAMWAGAENPNLAPFWVKKNGDIYCGNGTFNGDGKFTGTVQASQFLDSTGKSMMTNEQWNPEYLNLKGLTIKDDAGNIKFQVDSTGKVIINDGSINFGSVTGADELYDAIDTANSYASDAYESANDALAGLKLLADGKYKNGTFIDGKNLYAPNLYGDTITLMDGNGYEVGTMSLLRPTAEHTYAFDLTSNLSLRLQAGAGYNAYLGNDSAFFMCAYDQATGSNLATIGGGMRVTNGSYGTTLPTSNLQIGRVFFLLES